MTNVMFYMSLHLLISCSVLKSDDYFPELLSNIIKYFFNKNTGICFLKEEVNIFHIIEQALLRSKVPLFIFSINQLRNATVPCDKYIVALTQVEEFLKMLDFKNEYDWHFKPWSRILLLYESPLAQNNELIYIAHKLALDVGLLGSIHQKNHNIIMKNENDFGEYTNITFTSILENRTVIISDKKSLPSYWNLLKPKKLIPKLPQEEKFRIAVFNCSPYNYIQDDSVYKGVEAVVLKELGKLWPVEYIIVSKDGDPWFNTSHMVKASQVHLGACSPWRIYAFARNLDFAGIITETCSTFLVEKPRVLPAKYFLMYSLSKESYLATLLVIVLVTVLLATSVKFYTHFHTTIFENLAYEFFKTIRLLMGAGAEKLLTVNSVSASFLIVFFLFFCTIFSTFYSAGIASILYNPPYGHHVSTLQEMVDEKLQWFGQEHTADVLKLSGTFLHNALADLFVPSSGRVPNVTKNLPIPVVVLNKIFVCDWEDVPEHRRKYYKLLKDCYLIEFTGFILPKYSPFTRKVEEVITRLTELGIIELAVRIILNDYKKYQEGFFTNYVYANQHLNINIENMVGAFLLLGAGLVISVVVFLLELIVHYIRTKKNPFCEFSSIVVKNDIENNKILKNPEVNIII